MNTQSSFSRDASQFQPTQTLVSSHELGWNSMPSFTPAGTVSSAEVELGWDAMGAWGSQLPKSRATELINSLAPDTTPMGERRLLASFWLSMGVRSMHA